MIYRTSQDEQSSTLKCRQIPTLTYRTWARAAGGYSAEHIYRSSPGELVRTPAPPSRTSLDQTAALEQSASNRSPGRQQDPRIYQIDPRQSLAGGLFSFLLAVRFRLVANMCPLAGFAPYVDLVGDRH